MATTTRHRLAFLVVILVGFAIRLVAIRGIDLGLDGGLSLALAALPLSSALDFLAHDVHPPLYYILLRLWVGLVGPSPVAVKDLGALLGTLTLAALVAWVRALAGPRGALAAGVVLAVAPAAIETSANVREYPLALALLVLAAWSYSRWSGWFRWSFAVAGVLAVWTSYLATSLLVASAVDAAARRERRERLPWVVGVAASIAPWLAFAASRGLLQTLGSQGPRQASVASPSLLVQLPALARTLTGGAFLQPGWAGPVLAVVAAGILVTARRRKASTRKARPIGAELAFLGAGAVASLGLAVAVNDLWTREGLPARYAAPALPFLLVFLGELVARARPIAGAGAVALLVAAGTAGFGAWLARPTLPDAYWDPTALVGFLDATVTPRDAIVFVSPEQAGYYQSLSARPRPWVLVPTGTDYLQGDAAARAQTTLAPLLPRVDALWLVLYHPSLGEGDGKVVDWLSLNAYAAPSRALPDSDVAPFLSAQASSSAHAVDARLVGGVTLVRASWPTDVAAGGNLPLELTWQASLPVVRNLTVFVHLVDPDGKLRAQDDSVPANGRAPLPQWQPGRLVLDRHGLFVPAGAPSGQYWLEVGLYDGQGRLPLEAGGDTIRLGPIRVK